MLLKVIPLFVVIFISFFCYSSMLTLFVPLFHSDSSPLFMNTYSISTRNIISGIFLALYPLGQFLGSPIIGSFSDSYGQKKVLNISLLFSLIFFIGIGVSIQFGSLYLTGLFCFLAGLCESNMTIALSAITRIVPESNVNTYFSYAFVMCSLGYIFGSIFGGSNIYIGFSKPFYI